jgi:putative ABC transport system ATP-binding protein
MLDLVGLSQRWNHRPGQLSGGEQQRVAIARAMATDPAIVIADEPTGNLDGATGQQLLELMEEVREVSGTTFLVATHNMEVASRADRQLRLVDGTLAGGSRI